MSAWRREAINRLPEFRSLIETADQPMALWIELHFKFEDAFEENDDERVKRIMDFARWCLNSRDGDTLTAVIIGFFEHMPVHPGVRAAMPRLLGRDEFEELKSTFAYFVGDKIVGEIELAFIDNPPGKMWAQRLNSARNHRKRRKP